MGASPRRAGLPRTLKFDPNPRFNVDRCSVSAMVTRRATATTAAGLMPEVARLVEAMGRSMARRDHERETCTSPLFKSPDLISDSVAKGVK